MTRIVYKTLNDALKRARGRARRIQLSTDQRPRARRNAKQSRFAESIKNTILLISRPSAVAYKFSMSLTTTPSQPIVKTVYSTETHTHHQYLVRGAERFRTNSRRRYRVGFLSYDRQRGGINVQSLEYQTSNGKSFRQVLALLISAALSFKYV